MVSAEEVSSALTGMECAVNRSLASFCWSAGIEARVSSTSRAKVETNSGWSWKGRIFVIAGGVRPASRQDSSARAMSSRYCACPE